MKKNPLVFCLSAIILILLVFVVLLGVHNYHNKYDADVVGTYQLSQSSDIQYGAVECLIFEENGTFQCYTQDGELTQGTYTEEAKKTNGGTVHTVTALADDMEWNFVYEKGVLFGGEDNRAIRYHRISKYPSYINVETSL